MCQCQPVTALVIGLLVAVTAGLATQIPKIKADPAPERLLSSFEGNSERPELKFDEWFGETKTVVLLLVEAPDVFDQRVMQQVHDLSRHFEAKEWVEDVHSLTVLNIPRRIEGGTADEDEESLEDLEDLDLCYAPPFGSAKDLVIVGGSIAANAQRGISPAILPFILREELRSDTPPLVIDVRDEREYDTENLQGAVNIPLEDLRERMEEVPKDRPVVVHCSVGYRSYLAQQILRQNGWTNVRNLYGGFAFASGLDWEE